MDADVFSMVYVMTRPVAQDVLLCARGHRYGSRCTDTTVLVPWICSQISIFRNVSHHLVFADQRQVYAFVDQCLEEIGPLTGHLGNNKRRLQQSSVGHSC